MPLGEFIAEIGLRIVFEIVFYGVAYWTGFIALNILSFGTLNLTPLMTIEERNRSKKKKKQIDWSIWIHRPMQGKALKAEITCLVGILCWVAVGFGVYFATRGTEKNSEQGTVVDNRPPVRSRNDPDDYNLQPCCGVALPVAGATPQRARTYAK